jgi:hypothetical protein
MADPINIDGVLYEELGNGQMRVVGYANAPTARQGHVFTLPQSDDEIRQEGRQSAADQRAAADQRRQERADERQRDKDHRAELEWNATHNPDGTPKAKPQGSGKPMPDGVAKRYEQAISAFADFDRATGTFQDDFAGNSLTGGLENSIQNIAGSFGTPGQAQWWSDFKATDNVLRNALYGASLTAGEKAAYEATTISPRMDPAQIKANLARRMELAKNLLSRKTNFLKANGYDPDAVDALAGEYGDMIAAKPAQKADNEVPQPNGAQTKPEFYRYENPEDPEHGVETSVASGRTRIVRDPRMSAQVDAMINAGAAMGTINAVLKRQNFPTLNPIDFAKAKSWMRENPGKKYYGADVTRTEDLSLMQRAAGSDTGALLAHMGNMGSAGLAGALAGPTGQGALDAMAANSPNASFAGSLIGGTAGAFGLEAVAAARAPAAVARFAPRFADAAYGGALGFNQAREGEGLSGALWGAGTSALGGAIGQRVVSGAGSAIGGVRNEAVQVLRDRGIPLTVGQVVGNSGRVGAGIKKIEDALTSIPFVGGMVDARRREGIQAFNRNAFQDAAAPGANITATGSEGMAQVRQSVGDAYDRALDPVAIDPTDPMFGADIQNAIGAAERIPNVNAAQDAAMLGLQSRVDGAIDPVTGQIPGRNFQEAYRGMARTGRERANSDYGHELGQVMRQGQDALGEALERQHPGAFGEFIEANAANRRANVLAAALRPAGNNADELITPAQLNRADITSTSRLEGPINSAAGNRPFYDLANAGQRVLPSNLADSGTATRAMIAGITTGAAGTLGGGYAMGGTEGAAGAGLGTTLLLAAGGSRPAQRALAGIMADRPEYARILGQIVEDNARLGGTIGAGAGAALNGH